MFAGKPNRSTRKERNAGGLRYWVTFLALIAFSAQSYITQTHIHGAPSEASASHQMDAGAFGLNWASVQKSDPGKRPQKEDPAHCPLCQAVAASGSFIASAALVLLLPISFLVSGQQARGTIVRALIPRHNWLSRGPPAP